VISNRNFRKIIVVLRCSENYLYKFAVPIPNARVAELVDALDSKSCAARRAGSIPAPGTEIRVSVRARADTPL
jgi:hypothetical protein